MSFLIIYASFRFTGAIVHGTIVIVMLFWRPHPENPLIFFAIAGLWGVGDAVWQTQINGKISKQQKKKSFKNAPLKKTELIFP